MKKETNIILVVSPSRKTGKKTYSGGFIDRLYSGLHENSSFKIILIQAPPLVFYSWGPIRFLYLFILTLALLRKRPAIIHLHHATHLLLLGAMCKRILPSTKIIVTFHGTDAKVFLEKKTTFRRLLDCFDLGICVSDYLKSVVQSYGTRLQLITCPMGVDTQVFHRPTESVVKNYDLCFIGNVTAAKGCDILLKALKSIQLQGVSFCIVGVGPLLQSFEGLKNVSIKGSLSQTQIRQVLWQSRYLISLSKSEGFGLVACEAISCGTDVILSDIPAFREQVKKIRSGHLIEHQADNLEYEILKILSMKNQVNFVNKIPHEYTLTYAQHFHAQQYGKLLCISDAN